MQDINFLVILILLYGKREDMRNVTYMAVIDLISSNVAGDVGKSKYKQMLRVKNYLINGHNHTASHF